MTISSRVRDRVTTPAGVAVAVGRDSRADRAVVVAVDAGNP